MAVGSLERGHPFEHPCLRKERLLCAFRDEGVRLHQRHVRHYHRRLLKRILHVLSVLDESLDFTSRPGAQRWCCRCCHPTPHHFILVFGRFFDLFDRFVPRPALRVVSHHRTPHPLDFFLRQRVPGRLERVQPRCLQMQIFDRPIKHRRPLVNLWAFQEPHRLLLQVYAPPGRRARQPHFHSAVRGRSPVRGYRFYLTQRHELLLAKPPLQTGRGAGERRIHQHLARLPRRPSYHSRTPRLRTITTASSSGDIATRLVTIFITATTATGLQDLFKGHLIRVGRIEVVHVSLIVRLNPRLVVRGVVHASLLEDGRYGARLARVARAALFVVPHHRSPHPPQLRHRQRM